MGVHTFLVLVVLAGLAEFVIQVEVWFDIWAEDAIDAIPVGVLSRAIFDFGVFFLILLVSVIPLTPGNASINQIGSAHLSLVFALLDLLQTSVHIHIKFLPLVARHTLIFIIVEELTILAGDADAVILVEEWLFFLTLCVPCFVLSFLDLLFDLIWVLCYPFSR